MENPVFPLINEVITSAGDVINKVMTLACHRLNLINVR